MKAKSKLGVKDGDVLCLFFLAHNGIIVKLTARGFPFDFLSQSKV